MVEKKDWNTSVGFLWVFFKLHAQLLTSDTSQRRGFLPIGHMDIHKTVNLQLRLENQFFAQITRCYTLFDLEIWSYAKKVDR